MIHLLEEEYALYKRSTLWELTTVKKALSMLPRLNDDRENARLRAVNRILKERKAKK